MNSNSFSRFGLLWNFYRPCILRQWWWTAAVVFVIYLMGLLAHVTDSYKLFALTLTLLLAPVYFSPLAFATYRDRSTQVLLPATGSEKAVFMLAYTLIIFPLAIATLWYLFQGIFALIGIHVDPLATFGSRVDNDLRVMGLDDVSMFSLQRICSELIPAVVCLCVVVSSRTQRVMKGIAGAIVALVASSFIAGIYGFYIGIKVAALTPTDPGFEEAVKLVVADSAHLVMDILAVVMPIMLLGVVIFTWRRIAKVQV